MSISDWYDDRAHRADLDPRHDWQNDDIVDAAEFGATEDSRRWRTTSRAQRRRSEPWSPTDLTARFKRTSQADQPGAVRQFLLQLLIARPHLSVARCRQAVESRGLPTPTKAQIDQARAKAIEQNRATASARMQHPAGRGREVYRRVVQPTSSIGYVAPVKETTSRCPSCERVIRRDGGCGC